MRDVDTRMELDNHHQDALSTLREQIAALPTPQRVELLHELMGEAACKQVGIIRIPAGFKLTVAIPVFNEERWVRELIRRVQAVEIPKEIVIVDDFSTDNTRAILKELESDEVRVFYQPK